MPKTRKAGYKKKRGGSTGFKLMSAINNLLPSYLLYQAAEMQKKKLKKRGGRKTRRGGKRHDKKKRGKGKSRRR